MFETVRAIHDALRTQSTLVFVLTIGALGGFLCGGVAWVVDKSYKNSVEEKRRESDRSAPLTIECHVLNGSISNGEKKWIVINNPGRVGITDITIEGIKYIFDENDWKAHKNTLSQFFEIGVLAKIPDVAAGHDSQPIEMGKLKNVRLYTWQEAVRQQTGQNEPEPFRTYYCLRFTFRNEVTGRKLAYYKVTEAFEASPSFTEESRGSGGGGGVQHLSIYDVPDLIKEDARLRFGSELEEYKP